MLPHYNEIDTCGKRICFSPIWSCELSELCMPDACISSLQTQCVIKCQGRPFADATDAVALGPAPLGDPHPGVWVDYLFLRDATFA